MLFVLFCAAVMNAGVSRGRWQPLSRAFLSSLCRNSSQWSDLWMRGDEDNQRLEKHPVKEQLTVKMLESSDEGTYKVLDEHGLAISTVQLAVEGETPRSPTWCRARNYCRDSTERCDRLRAGPRPIIAWRLSQRV